MQRCHPSPLSRYRNLMPYQTDPLVQSGRRHKIPAILSLDDLHPGDDPIRPSLASHSEHTDPVVYCCRAAWASPHDLVLCFGCSGLSHLLGILPAFFMVVSSETSGQNSGLHGAHTPSCGWVSAVHLPHFPGTVAVCTRGSCHILGP